VLSGVPDGPGRAEVVIAAVIDLEVRRLDDVMLSWGREKLLGLETVRVGECRQEFTVEVRP